MSATSIASSRSGASTAATAARRSPFVVTLAPSTLIPSYSSTPSRSFSLPVAFPRSATSTTTPIRAAVDLTRTSIQRRGYHEKVSSAPIGFNVNCHSLSNDLENQVIDHYENPRNVGSMPKADPNVGTGIVGAPACGDVMKLQILVDDATGEIREVKFKTFGCGSAIASSSLATEKIKGLKVWDAAKIKNTDIAKELALPPVKLHCSMLAEDAIKSAVRDWEAKRATRKDAVKLPSSGLLAEEAAH
ncbi:NifU-like N terminal domain-containing protein [Zopfochytrium polystomum]|nr:NifU-like N terminal domain-containing protein [Zopfochytrium polystomum]